MTRTQPPIKNNPIKMTTTPSKIKSKIISVLHWLRVWGKFVLNTSKNILLLFGAYLPTTLTWVYLYWDHISIVCHEITLWSFVFIPVFISLSLFFAALLTCTFVCLWKIAYKETCKKIVLSFGRGVINCAIIWSAKLVIFFALALFVYEAALVTTSLFDIVINWEAAHEIGNSSNEDNTNKENS